MGKTISDLFVIPGGMISQLQALEVVVNKLFKDHLWQLYNDLFLKRNHALTSGGKQKLSVTMLREWIHTAWGTITSESIIAGLKKQMHLE
jgi:hypothetical protein